LNTIRDTCLGEFFSRPYGTRRLYNAFPAIKSLGYDQMALRATITLEYGHH
jgi:hypothetical protein